MLERFYPDYKYKAVQDIAAGFFKERGIRYAVLDIDNTLVPYTVPEPTQAALEFLERLRGEGVQFCFVSNNRAERVQLFNQTIGAWYCARAKKPLRVGIGKALAHFGAKPEETVLIGDQIFTDVWGGRRAGLVSVLVGPIEEKETLFFRFKRRLEKIVLNRYESTKEAANHV